MRKILYLITQSELGGAQRYIFDLASNLKNDFEIAVAFGEPGEDGELALKLKKAQIPFFVLPHLKRAISPVNDFLALIEIIKLIKKFQPDIIHLNSSKISILGSIALSILKIKVLNWKLKIVNCKLIYTVHGWVFNEPQSVWKKKFYFYQEKFTGWLKDKLICVSEFDWQVGLKTKVVTEKKLITIHNGLKPINFLNPEAAKEKFSVILSGAKDLKSSEIKQDSSAAGLRMTKNITICSIGNFYKTKGFAYLIQAGKILKDNKINFQIIIIGAEREPVELKKQIIDLDLTDNFILPGNIKNAAELLPAFDIYVCSSVKEGLPYSVLEAMQAGLPIVATKVGGIPELITNEQEGLLVDSQNPEQIATAIMKFLNNRALMETCGRNAKQKALTEFSLTAMAEKTKAVYDNL